MNKKILWAILVIVVIGIIYISFRNSPIDKSSGDNQGIKIGAVLSLSGPAVQDGESIKNGIELAKSDLKKKGINVEIIYQDDQTDGKNTVSAINMLSGQGVQAIIGPTWSFLGDAGVPVVDKLKLVSIMPANTSEYVNAKSPYAFYTTTKVSQLVTTLADWLKKNNKKSIAMISNQGAWYSTVEKAVKEAANLADAKIVFNESIVFGQEATSLPTVLAKMKNAKADILFTEIDSDAGVAVMFKKISELQMTGDVMSISTSIGRVVRSNPDGLNFGNNKVYVLAPVTSNEFISKYEAFYGQKPSAYADTAYDSLMLLVDAIQNKGETDLAYYLRNVTDYQGFAHKYQFDLNGDIVGGNWVVNTIK